MDIEAARAELTGALDGTAHGELRFRAAREVLINRGIEALEILPRPGISLDEIVRVGAGVPPTDARRAFAVLLVHAIGIEGLLPTRGETEGHIRSFLERALLNPLRRAGYPFDGAPYDKRRALAGLHATIDEHLRPLEPTIPRWIHGVGPRTEG
jgi:hypothetical protein